MSNVKKSVAERTRHQRQYDKRVNKRQMQTQERNHDLRKALDAGLVVKESSGTESGKQDTSSKSGNDADADNEDIKPVYDEEPMVEVQLTVICNIFATGQHHAEQPEIINKGKVEQYIEQCEVKSPMLDSSLDFSRMEAHCIALELKYPNQALKSGQQGQILNETSNKAKMKNEIVAFETINIKLEHSVATLLVENEHLHKENEHLKQTYKDLYDSIKKTRLRGNSVDTKFAKPSVLGKPVLQPLKKQSVVRQLTAFKSERPKISKPWFASQVDVKQDLSKPVTQHYLPKERESAFAKPDHVIASSESRNSSKNMSRFSSNDMVHNYYLEEVKKKTQEKDRNSKSSVMHFTRIQNTTNGSKPKPMINNQTSRSLLIFTGHRFSPNKSSDMYEKTSPRSCLRWKSTGKIFKTVGLRLIPTGKLLDSCTIKVDSKPSHGSNVDISKIHECKQTQILSTDVPIADMIVMTSMIELESIFDPLFDEYINEENKVVSKSSAVTTADASDKRQQQPDSTSYTSTLATTVTADGNFDLYIFLFFSLF
ncbi:hypothetical protein Tco_0232556 [Tanacetum coccineum]